MTPDAAPLRLLIVDDEAPARQRLARLLAALPGVELAGEAGDGARALELAESLAPDALLLDIRMPEISGLDVAASLPDGGPAVIFVTAFDDYALQAFDAAALDYLLKPVDPARLARALERLRTHLHHRMRGSATAPARLLVNERGRVQVIACADIHWLQAADNYVEVHAGAAVHLLRRTLESLLADLGPGFVRIHRGHAVALRSVSRVEPRARGDALVHLGGALALPCSRAYRAALIAALAAAAASG